MTFELGQPLKAERAASGEIPNKRHAGIVVGSARLETACARGLLAGPQNREVPVLAATESLLQRLKSASFDLRRLILVLLHVAGNHHVSSADADTGHPGSWEVPALEHLEIGIHHHQ